MKSDKTVYLPWILANIMLITGAWLDGIEIGSWRIGGVQWAWGGVLGNTLFVAACILMSVLIIRFERRKRH